VSAAAARGAQPPAVRGVAPGVRRAVVKRAAAVGDGCDVVQGSVLRPQDRPVAEVAGRLPGEGSGLAAPEGSAVWVRAHAVCTRRGNGSDRVVEREPLVEKEKPYGADG
jgi:hypothetical protein